MVKIEECRYQWDFNNKSELFNRINLSFLEPELLFFSFASLLFFDQFGTVEKGEEE